jgi:uncharacterized protein (DUF1697 family)
MKDIISMNPFLEQPAIAVDKLHVMFLEETPGKTRVASLEHPDHSPDRFTVIGKTIFLYCPNGIIKLYRKFFESELKVRATMRNWKTIKTLIAMAEDLPIKNHF